MKFRNLFLVGLAACTLASCSKDEAVDNGPKEPVDASISIAASALMTTKAGGDTKDLEQLQNESFVKTLTAYVFKVPEGIVDESQMILAGKKTLDSKTASGYLVESGKGLVAIDHILVKVSPNSDGTSSSDKFKVVLVANGVDVVANNLSELKTKVITQSIDKYKFTAGQGLSVYLPMASSPVEITGLAPNVQPNGNKVENWINMSGSASISRQPEDAGKLPEVGAIALTRLIARVQVEGVTVNIQNNYPGATFELQNLALVNVRPTSTLNGGNGDWVKGFQSSGYKPTTPDNWIFENSKNTWETYQQALSRSYIVSGVGIVMDESKNTHVKTWGKESEDKFYAYAFSNTDAKWQTALLITGKFYRKGDTNGEVRNFRVFLQDPDHPEKGIQVLANNVYKLAVTITGEGSPNEDEILLNAHIGAVITVNPWNVIIQDEEDAS